MKKYNCKVCAFYTDRKGDFTRHEASDKHKKRITQQYVDIMEKSKSSLQYSTSSKIHNSLNTVRVEDKPTCSYCKVKFTYSKNLMRHIPVCPMKIDYIEKYREIMARNKELEEELKDLRYEYDYTKDLLIDSKTELADSKDEIVHSLISSKPNPNLYSFVVDKFQKTKPLVEIDISEVPELKFLKEILDEKDGELELCEVLQHHVLHETSGNFFGDFVVDSYIESDKSKQQFFNTDAARLNYLVRDSINDVPKWRIDKSGIILAKKIITPILDYIKKHLVKYGTKYFDMTTKKYKYDTVMGRNYRLLKLTNEIDNGKLTKKILRYIAPYFKMDKEVLHRIKPTKTITKRRTIKRTTTKKPTKRNIKKTTKRSTKRSINKTKRTIKKKSNK